jgi:hypothetical protein
MSQKETTATVGRLEAGESQVGNLSGLTELAREAFEQKRTKDCLDLTRAILLVDPGNADAQAMRLAIQSEMHRDLDNARAFIRQAQTRESLEPQQQPAFTEAASENDMRVQVERSQGRLASVVSSTLLQLSEFFHKQRPRRVRWLLSVLGIVIVGVVLLSLSKFKTGTRPVESSLVPLASADVPKPAVSEESHPPLIETPIAVVPSPAAVPSKAPAAIPTAVTAARTVATLPDVPVVAGTGILAVSSPGAVDIYEGDAYLGSVPVSLELSSGEHTLEYRHGTLRKFVTHVINRNETSKAMVVFDVTVQVNSKPWSEVFLDGVERKDLGQTPLSGVRVPIGGVLIFENPQFQAKRYRITGNETGIQIVFP